MDSVVTPTPSMPTVVDSGPSALDVLKDKLAKARVEAAAKLAFELPVPRMDMLVVRYRPVDQRVWTGILDRASKQPDVTPLDINCRLLAAHVEGVFVDDGEKLVSADLLNPDQEAPRFEQRLAEALGIDWNNDQSDLVKRVYLTDGDVISTAAAVLDLSGFGRADEIEASVRGN